MQIDNASAKHRGFDAPALPARWRKRFARAGLIAFLFFLVKGVAWLAVPYVLFLINQ